MLQLNKQYMDDMDRTRKITPISIEGKNATCKIHWRQTSGNGTDVWIYGGKASLPVSLFNARPGLGFSIPVNVVVQAPLKSFEEVAADQLK
jgi:hypothetical protein